MQNTKLTKLRNRINRSRERFNRLYYSDDSARSRGADDNATGSRESTDSRRLVNAALERVAKECEDCKKSGKTESGPLKLPNISMERTLKIGEVIAKKGES